MSHHVSDAPTNPYVGPKPYKKTDSNRFFGRNRELRELEAILGGTSSTLLFAQSGVGKSSLIEAGLIPYLEESGYQVLGPARTSPVKDEPLPKHPPDNRYVFWALKSLFPDAHSSDLLHATFSDRLVWENDPDRDFHLRVVVFDQFEEMFTAFPGSDYERHDFFDQLRRAMEGSPVLLGLSEVVDLERMGRELTASSDIATALRTCLDEVSTGGPDVDDLRRTSDRHTLALLNSAIQRGLIAKTFESLGAEGERILEEARALTHRNGDGLAFNRNVLSAAFPDVFRPMVQGDPTLRALFVMREDYIGHIESYRSKMPDKIGGRYRLMPMAKDSALLAIVEPARQFGVEYEVDITKGIDVANTLVKDLISSGGKEAEGKGATLSRSDLPEFVDLLQLQIVCQRLWAAKGTGTVIDETMRLNEGTVEGALAKHYDDGLAAILSKAAEEKIPLQPGRLRNWFERRLLSRDGQRVRVSQGPEETADMPNRIVEFACEESLLRRELLGGTPTYEIPHDRFRRIILESNRLWREDKATLVAKAQELEDRASQWNLGRGRLLTPAEYQACQSVYKEAEILGPVPVVDKYLAASARHIEQLTVGRRIKAWAVGGMVALAVGVAGLQIREARASARRLEIESSLAMSATVNAIYHAGDRHLAQKLAVKAYRNDVAKGLSTLRAEDELREAMGRDGSVVDLGDQQEAINGVAFSPDGRTMALAVSGSIDACGIDLVDVATRKHIRHLPNDSAVISVAYSPDGRYLAAAAHNGIIRIYSTKTFNQIREEGIQAHYGAARSVTFSQDGTMILSAGEDKRVALRRVRDGQLVREFKGHRNTVRRAYYDHDYARILSVSEDATLRVWDAKTGDVLSIAPLSSPALDAKFSENGKFVAASAIDPGVSIVNAEGIRREPLNILYGHMKRTRSVLFASGGKQLLTASDDGTVGLIDTADFLRSQQPRRGRRMREDSSNIPKFLPVVDTPPPGDSLKTGYPPVDTTGDRDKVIFLALAPDRASKKGPPSPFPDQILATSSTGKEPKVRFWRLVKDSRGLISQIHFVGTVANRSVKVARGLDQTTANKVIVAVGFDPYSRRFLTVDDVSQQIAVWDVDTGQRKETYNAKDVLSIRTAFFSGHRLRKISILSKGGKSAEIDRNTDQQSTTPFLTPGFECVAASRAADGTTMTAIFGTPTDGPSASRGSNSNRINSVIKLRKGSTWMTIRADSSDRPRDIAISADGNKIAAGYERDRVRVFESTGSMNMKEVWKKRLSELEADLSNDDPEAVPVDNGLILCLALSKSGKYLAVGTSTCVIVLDAQTGAIIDRSVVKGGAVRSVAWGRATDVFCAGSDEGSAEIFEVLPKTNEEKRRLKRLRTLYGHDGPINSLVFIENDSRIVTGSSDKTAIVFPTTIEKLLEIADRRVRYPISRDDADLYDFSRDMVDR